MEEILHLLQDNARLSVADIAAMTKKTVDEVQQIISGLEKDGVILKYAAIVNPEKVAESREKVRAEIEIQVTPEREHGFDAISTSLLISPSQKHEQIRSCGEEMARRYGVEFLYRDFRPGFRAGQARARELGFYMQKYCGCIFSEEERYAKQIQRDRQRSDEAAR